MRLALVGLLVGLTLAPGAIASGLPFRSVTAGTWYDPIVSAPMPDARRDSTVVPDTSGSRATFVLAEEREHAEKWVAPWFRRVDGSYNERQLALLRRVNFYTHDVIGVALLGDCASSVRLKQINVFSDRWTLTIQPYRPAGPYACTGGSRVDYHVVAFREVLSPLYPKFRLRVLPTKISG